MFIVIEGIDGAGKQTLSAALVDVLRARGKQVSLMAFPAYGTSLHADLVARALHGEMGDLADSVYGMGLLYALDRKVMAPELRLTLAMEDVVICDRYVASNLAYGAARLHQRIDGDFACWVEQLEFVEYGIPIPDVQVFLDVPANEAARRMDGRDSKQDILESDRDLQARVSDNYRKLAGRSWVSPWWVVDGTQSWSVDGLADDLLKLAR